MSDNHGSSSRNSYFYDSLNRALMDGQKTEAFKKSLEQLLITRPDLDRIDVIVTQKDVKTALAVLDAVEHNPEVETALFADEVLRMIELVLNHGKSFELVAAIRILKNQPDTLSRLVDALIEKKDVYSMADALCLVPDQSKIEKNIAEGVMRVASVDQLIRVLEISKECGSHIQTLFAMEIMAQGSLKQFIEALEVVECGTQSALVLTAGILQKRENSDEVETVLDALVALVGEEHRAVQLLVQEIRRIIRL